MTVPSVLDPSVRRWLRDRRQGVLVTLRRDGTAQTSNVAFHFDEEAGTFGVSVTATRAKTNNLRRDPRAVLHVLGPTFASYISVRSTASLGPVSTAAGDGAGQDLLALYETISSGRHPDRDEFFAAMVADRRLMLTLTPVDAVVGSSG